MLLNRLLYRINPGEANRSTETIFVESNFLLEFGYDFDSAIRGSSHEGNEVISVST
jgi:hypothetical protein